MRPSTYRVLGWCAVGILLGLAFPVAAWVWASGGNLGWATIRAAHRDQPVLTIIDTAPLVLGIAGAIVGVLQQRIHEAYDRCETTVRERTGELQTANNRLVSLMDAKDQFVSTVGHELRTPITSVTGFAEVLRESHRTSTPEEISELVEVIALQAAEVVDILDDLLVASRGQISGLSIENQHLDLSDLSTES